MLKQSVPKADRAPVSEDTGSAQPPAEPADVVTVRNYDHSAGHSIHVTVSDASGRVQLTERCYLAPGQSRRLAARVAPAAYRIGVRVDGVERSTTEHRLDADGAHTAVVEIGTRSVSISPGPADLISA